MNSLVSLVRHKAVGISTRNGASKILRVHQHQFTCLVTLTPILEGNVSVLNICSNYMQQTAAIQLQINKYMPLILNKNKEIS